MYEMWGIPLKAKNSVSNAEISKRLKKMRENSGLTSPKNDESYDKIVESGKGLMNGLGGIIIQAKEDLDYLYGARSSGQASTSTKD